MEFFWMSYRAAGGVSHVGDYLVGGFEFEGANALPSSPCSAEGLCTDFFTARDKAGLEIRQVVGVDFLGVSSAAAILEIAKRGLPVPQVCG
jgi:hypothetical protein